MIAPILRLWEVYMSIGIVSGQGKTMLTVLLGVVSGNGKTTLIVYVYI